jgi:serine/threonine protein kinase
MELIDKKEIGQRYLADALLGEGAHAAVYRAHDAVRKGRVALKVFAPDALDEQVAEAAAHFEVSNSNAILELLEVHPNYLEGPVTVMPLMTGTLADLSSMFASKAIYYTRRLLTALEYCHNLGVIHGDVKPTNMFLTANDALRLGDFGVRDFLPDGSRGHTLEYASPELAMGQPRSVVSDLWAVGVTLYQLLCGELPFGSRSNASEDAVIERIGAGHFSPPDAICPYLPIRFRRFFEACFKVDPNERGHSSAAALRLGLSDLTIRAEWLRCERDGVDVLFEGHELTDDMRRTGLTYEATIRERPRKGDFEAVITRRPRGGRPRRMTGVEPFHGSRAQAKQKLKIWMRSLTDKGSLT